VHADVDQPASALQVFATEGAPARDAAAAQRLHPHVDQVAEHTRRNLFAQETRGAGEALLKADRQVALGRHRCGVHAGALAGAHRHRFFHQHMTARAQGIDRRLQVQEVWRAHANRVEPRLRQQFAIVRIPLGHVVFLAKLPQGLRLDVGRGCDLHALHLGGPQVFDMGVGDAGDSDETEAKRWRRTHG
jgi:hypothetical protein